MNALMLTKTLSVSLGVFIGATAFAQDDPIATEEMEKKALADSKMNDGWHLGAKVGGSAAFNHAHQVVGAEQGATFQLGVVLGGDLDFKSGQHLWENDLNIQEGQTKTPQIDRFVKSSDQLDFKSTYSYRLAAPDWMGFYGRASLNTQLLPTDAVRVKEGVRTDVDGNVVAGTEFQAQEGVELTGAFEPVALRQTVGLFANPVEEKRFTLKIKVGAGAQEVVARDGLVVIGEGTDDAGLILLQTKQLDSSFSLGAEVGVDANGFIVDDVLSWTGGAYVFQPFYTTSDQKGLDALSTELSAGLSVKLAKWASLEYVLSARRQPLVVDQWQIQNALILTAGFDIL